MMADDECDEVLPPPTSNIFDSFLQCLPPRLTKEQQQTADFRRLWMDSSRIVIGVFITIVGRNPPEHLEAMDMIQEGLLAVGEGLRSWNPDKGRLSTYLVPRIRGAMLDYINDERKQLHEQTLGDPGDLERHFENDERYDELREAMQYIDDQEHKHFIRELRSRINTLSDEDKDILFDRFWFDETMTQMAKSRGISRGWMHEKLEKLLRTLRQ